MSLLDAEFTWLPPFFFLVQCTEPVQDVQHRRHYKETQAGFPPESFATPSVKEEERKKRFTKYSWRYLRTWPERAISPISVKENRHYEGNAGTETGNSNFIWDHNPYKWSLNRENERFLTRCDSVLAKNQSNLIDERKEKKRRKKRRKRK